MTNPFDYCISIVLVSVENQVSTLLCRHYLALRQEVGILGQHNIYQDFVNDCLLLLLLERHEVMYNGRELLCVQLMTSQW